MRRFLAPILALPLLAAGNPSNKEAIQLVLYKMMAGEALPPEILDRQVGHPELPDLDHAIARVPGCKVSLMESLQNGAYAVQWKCNGRPKAERPSVMMVYANKGRVTKLTTAIFLGSR